MTANVEQIKVIDLWMIYCSKCNGTLFMQLEMAKAYNADELHCAARVRDQGLTEAKFRALCQHGLKAALYCGL